MGKPARKRALTPRAPRSLAALRRRAEQLVAKADAPAVEVSHEALRRMLHELQVHEIELEMQNEELIRTRLELKESHDHYADLFNLAPVAYVVMDADETVCEANVAAARLFGFELQELEGWRFSRLAQLESREELRAHLHQVRHTGKRLGCEVEFAHRDGPGFTGHVESEAFMLPDNSRMRVRSAIVDVSARREAERLRRQSERERLRRQSERELVAVSEHEKQRLGADLHDGLGQWLTATEFLGAALREKLAAQCPELVPQCAQVCANLRDAITQTRAMARGLAPVRMEQGGLTDALTELAHSIDGLNRVRCRLDCPNPVFVPQPVVANHLYRIAQEAVNNALRHGNPRKIRITLEASDERLRLRINDDGRGFDPTRRPLGSLGLDSMRHRATVLGARLNIEAAPDQGVVVECDLPWPPSDE